MPGIDGNYPLSLFRDALRSSFATALGLLVAAVAGSGLAMVASSGWPEGYFFLPAVLEALLGVPLLALVTMSTPPGLFLGGVAILCAVLFALSDRWRLEFLLLTTLAVSLHMFTAFCRCGAVELSWTRFLLCPGVVALFCGALHGVSWWLARQR